MAENPHEPLIGPAPDDTKPGLMPLVETIVLVCVVGGLFLSALASVIWIVFSSAFEFHNG